jgi:hypothetical protein
MNSISQKHGVSEELIDAMFAEFGVIKVKTWVLDFERQVSGAGRVERAQKLAKWLKSCAANDNGTYRTASKPQYAGNRGVARFKGQRRRGIVSNAPITK